MAQQSLKVGLVGYGLAGKHFHSPLFEAAGLELVAVNSSRPSAVHADFPKAEVYAELDEMLARDDLELIVNASPSSEHAPIAMKALAAGKNVINDKPFAATLAEADAVLAAAKAAGKLVTCYQNRRWDADFLTIRKLLDDGRLGNLKSYRARFDVWRPVASELWRDQPGVASGLLADLGTHLIDQALTLFGTPDWIEAEVMAQRDVPTVSDGFLIRMGKGQLSIELGSTAFAADHRQRFVLHGTEGSFVKATMDPQEQVMRHEGGKATDPGFGVEAPEAWGELTRADATGENFLTERVPSETGSWVSLYRNVAQAIRGEAELIVTPEQARNCIYVMEMAQKASDAQRRLAL